MPRLAVELTVRHITGVANPLDQGAAWYVLVELSSAESESSTWTTLLGEVLQLAAARDIIRDASIATSMAQAEAMWKLRESVPEAQRHHGASLKHDVSVPVSSIPRLIESGGCAGARGWCPRAMSSPTGTWETGTCIST